METLSTLSPRPAATQDATPPASSARKPIAVLRFGAVSAAVFANDVKTGGRTITLRSVSLRRVYRDAQGALRYTHSLRPQDLLLASFALLKAFDLLEGPRTSPEE